MRIETERLIIHSFERKDAEDLVRIVRQSNIVHFMEDWSENRFSADEYYSFIDWQKTKEDSNDIYNNKRYAVALKDNDKLIGMVGMGLEEILNEVEVAYFISEEYCRNGFGFEAVMALLNWCFKISNINYLILTIDIATISSQKLAEKCDFELFEKRTPIGHSQPNMESESYYYYRKSNQNFSR